MSERFHGIASKAKDVFDVPNPQNGRLALVAAGVAIEKSHRLTGRIVELAKGFTFIGDKGPKPPPPPSKPTIRFWPGGDSVKPRGAMFSVGDDSPLIRPSRGKGDKKGPGGFWNVDRSGH